MERSCYECKNFKYYEDSDDWGICLFFKGCETEACMDCCKNFEEDED